ncbi:hypothetical protein V6N12_017516 [Hibiscus sabdariffa]|uniref:Uncharacterized protein n=1 Tax=Hibiscus sabdariffa TaxID=183260 RepID=A0ABR2CG75_9ROSI
MEEMVQQSSQHHRVLLNQLRHNCHQNHRFFTSELQVALLANKKKKQKEEAGSINGMEGSVFIGAASAAVVVGRRSRSFLQLEGEDAPT